MSVTRQLYSYSLISARANLWGNRCARIHKLLTILFLAGATAASAADLPALAPVDLPPPPTMEILATQHVSVRGQEISFTLVKFPDGMVCQNYIQNIKLMPTNQDKPVLDVQVDEICDEPAVAQGPGGELRTYPRRLRGLLWVSDDDGLGRHALILDTRAR